MDPAVFFGRSRPTRQTLKMDRTSSADCYTSREVTARATRSCVRNSGKPTKALASVQLEASGKKNVSKAIGGRGKKNIMKGSEDDSAPSKVKEQSPCIKRKRVQFGPNEKTEPDDGTQSCPVYKNVRRSDVVGDPSDEYEFPVDENDEPLKKKKKPRKASVVKKKNFNCGLVVWDPSKRPIIKKTGLSKVVKPKVQKLVSEAPVQIGAIVDTVNSEPDSLKKSQPQHLKPTKVSENATKALRNSTVGNPVFDNSNIVKPSPTDKPPHSKGQGSAVSSKSSSFNHHLMAAEEVQDDPIMPSEQSLILSEPKPITVMNRSSIPSKSVGSSSMTPDRVSSLSFKAGNHFASTPVTSTRHALSTPNNAVSSASSCSSKSKQPISNSQKPRISLPTPLSKSSAIPVVSVRESPSFKEPENPVNSPNLFDVPCSESLEGVTSTPVTRSKPALTSKCVKVTSPSLSAASPSPNEVTNAPVHISNSPVEHSWDNQMITSNDDTFEILNDLPRTSVIPTRMFSTHRGTIYVPHTESHVTKRKLPALSPSKALKCSRSTTVKFSVPQLPSNCNDCFGFDEDDLNETLPPVPQKAPQVHKTKRCDIKKPNLSIQEVQAILRGQLKATSPANSTPRTLQTKLTDFVSTTPSTPSRSSPKSVPSILTPTPVPLFGEEEIDRELPSPFIQPSRRSYDRFHRGKRIACGDEVHSDEEEGNMHPPQSACSAVPEVPKKNRSYRKKKKPADAQLDTWANQLASHFDEVEEVELQVE